MEVFDLTKKQNVCHCEENEAKRNLTKQSRYILLYQEVLRLLRSFLTRNDIALFLKMLLENYQKVIKLENFKLGEHL